MHKIIKLLTLSFSANIKHGQGNIRCLYKLYLISFGMNIFQALVFNINANKDLICNRICKIR